MGLFGGCNNGGDRWIWIIIIIVLVLCCCDGDILGSNNNDCCYEPCHEPKCCD